MILPLHNLRSHISWCSRCVFLVLSFHSPRDAKISNSQVALLVKNEILRFEISVDYVLFVEVLKGEDKTRNEELHLLFTKPSPLP